MQVLIFSTHYLPHLGGIEIYTDHIAKELTSRGHQVTIVTSNTENSLEYEEKSGLEIFRLPCYKLLGGRFPISKLNKQFSMLKKRILTKKYDCAIINARFYPHSIVGAHFARRQNIRPIVIDHGTGHFTVNHKLLDFCGHIYEHFVTWVLKRYKPAFFGVSKACSVWLKHFHIASDGELYNAIDIGNIESITQSANCNYRELYHIDSHQKIIVYTGRLIAEKGVKKLIQAVQQVNSQMQKVVLFIAGNGPLSDEIGNLNDSAIHYLGKITFQDVIMLLSQSDIFCLPTEFAEGFPTSVLEGVATKNFVITTSAGGSKELITDANHGVILRENTSEEIATSILRALENKDYYEGCVENAYEALKNNFTWSRTVDDLIAFLQKEGYIHE